MRTNDSYPRPVSDPAADGIPEYADDDSYAEENPDSPRVAEGPAPVALPPDREDGPEGLDDFGITAEEQLRGESLDRRLAREEADVDPDDVAVDADPRLADEATTQDAAAQVNTDADMLDDGPVDPALDSQVSMYERLGTDPQTGGRVGRIMELDEGGGIDPERDSVAYDVGSAGGGPSAEEAAMHEVRETDRPATS